jgi:hypothetical protein
LVNDVARFNLILLAAAALLLLCGCINESGEATRHSGLVTGYVLTAPVCPVERVGQDCPPRPVSGAAVVALAGDAVRGSTLTDAAGAFNLTLADGWYIIKASNVGGYASAASKHVVISDKPVHITLIVDSGIR